MRFFTAMSVTPTVAALTFWCMEWMWRLIFQTGSVTRADAMFALEFMAVYFLSYVFFSYVVFILTSPVLYLFRLKICQSGYFGLAVAGALYGSLIYVLFFLRFGSFYAFVVTGIVSSIVFRTLLLSRSRRG